MVRLYQFPIDDWVLPNPSPFCLKLETWLRLADIPYETQPWSPMKAPLGKAPFIDHQGELVPDSSRAIAYLIEAFDVQLDADLTAEQSARSLLVQRLVEEHLYWALLYSRWVEDSGWAAYNSVVGSSMPALARPFLLPRLRRGVIRSCKAHGLGRHDRAEIIGRACADLDALATVLGDQAFIVGETPHTVDATAYAFLASFIVPDLPHPIRTHARGCDPLVAYVERVRQRCWSDRPHRRGSYSDAG